MSASLIPQSEPLRTRTQETGSRQMASHCFTPWVSVGPFFNLSRDSFQHFKYRKTKQKQQQQQKQPVTKQQEENKGTNVSALTKEGFKAVCHGMIEIFFHAQIRTEK